MNQAQTYIDKFNGMHKKWMYKKDIVGMLHQVQGAKLPELKEVETRLSNLAERMNGKPVQILIKHPVKLKEPKKKKKVLKSSIVPKVKKVTEFAIKVKEKKIKNTSSKKIKALNGVVDASAIASLNFSQVELDGKYKSDFVRMYSDTQFMFWGKPGHGKTVALLQFAQYLSDKKKLKVLYIADEEMNRSTLTEKIREFKIGNENLKFVKDLDALKRSGKSIHDFDAIFFDSVQSLGFTLESYKKFVKNNPGRIYVLIVQSTKDGSFKGGQDWLHEVDIAGEFVNYKLIIYKNRLDSQFAEKSNKLLIDEKVNEGKKKLEIREKIKGSMQPKVITTEENQFAAL